jgi:hypothetical protein
LGNIFYFFLISCHYQQYEENLQKPCTYRTLTCITKATFPCPVIWMKDKKINQGLPSPPAGFIFMVVLTFALQYLIRLVTKWD